MPITKKNPRGSRVVLYARVSTEEQAGEEHFSIDAQFAEMREMAAKKGATTVRGGQLKRAYGRVFC